jgi:hypothetical protein
MDQMAGIVLIMGLSVSPLLLFIACFYGDRRAVRNAKTQEMLLQRIQAPQVAVDQHVIQQAEEQKRMTPHFDSDEEFQRLDEMMIGIDPLGEMQ